MGAGALRLLASLVEVGDQMIQSQKKEDTSPKADNRRQEGPSSHPGGLLHGGDQQAPDGRSNHNAGGKTGQSALHPIPKTLFQEEYTGSAQGGAEKWGE